MTFDNIDEALEHIQKQVNETLKDEVSEAVKNTMMEEIDNEVYSKYHPRAYARRGRHGGLGDKRNMDAILVGDGELEVYNNTPFNESYNTTHGGGVANSLAEAVERGIGYDFGNGSEGYLRPRPFMAKTAESLEESGKVGESLKRGLKKRGIDVV